MRRFNSPAIVAILAALAIYVGVICFMYGLSVHNGRKLEQHRTNDLMNTLAWNVEETLYTMNDNGYSYLSSIGQVEREWETGLSRIILTQQDYERLCSKRFATSLEHLVNSSYYLTSAFFCFEPKVFGYDTYQPFYHRGDSTLRNTDELFHFYESDLYDQVYTRHHNWWYVSHHLTVFGEPVLSCCTPIYLEDTTQFLGAFVMDYSLTSLNKYIRDSKPYDEAELFIINIDDHIIASTDSTYFGCALQDMPEWNPKIFGNAEVKFPLLPWRLRMYTPKVVVQETLLRFLHQFLFYGLIGLLLIGVCLFFAIRSIKRSQRQQHAIENELHMASAIQRALLPTDLPQCPEAHIDALLRPAKEVAGDLYEVQLIDHYLYFMIGDVSGKGMQASIMMSMINGLYRHEVSRNVLPSEIMTELNRSLAERNPNMLFCTMLIGRLDRRTGELYLCNAGHNLPVLRGQLLSLQANLVLGIMPDYIYEDEVHYLQPNETLLCYTDGVTEAMNSDNQLFGEQQLLSLPTDIHTILQSVDTFANGRSQSDDITMLSLTYTPFTLRCIDDIAHLRDFVSLDIQLPIEELAVNALTHGQAHWVTVSIYEHEGSVHAVLMDDGTAFDPTQHTPTSPQEGDEEQLIVGGQGLNLVQQMTSALTYTHDQSYNHLDITY